MSIPILISYGEFRTILRQAQREEEATEAGFATHEEMVTAHRAARVVKLRAARMARVLAGKEPADSLDATLAKIFDAT